MASHWSRAEVDATVVDYFKMLRLELTQQPFNKTQHRRALMERLNNRSERAVESKHQNISAVLREMRVPWIEGYKPLSNYQRTVLPEAVIDHLKAHPDLQDLFQDDAQFVPPMPTVEDFLAAREAPPKVEEPRDLAVREATPIYNPAGVNYLEREARNQFLGDAGELFVVNFERARLIRAGQDALADRIEQVSVTRGPAAGFDILSFEEDGSDRFIEAKTTKYGKHTPFFVTPNELRFSRQNSQRYHLYRIFGFREAPRLFTLKGRLEEQCRLEPTEFMARLA